MASVCARAARGTLQASSSSLSATRNAISKLCNINKSSQFVANGASKLPGLAASPKSNSTHRLFTSSRLPVELGCAQSLMPLHSATASALFTSMLSLHSQSWGCLSEGFATPL